MEILFLLLWKMRQEKEFNRDRAIIQAQVLGLEDGKAAIDAFKDYQNSWMPFMKKAQELEDTDIKEFMHREIAKGPLKVVPMREDKPKGISQGLIRGQEALQKRADLLKTGKLKTLDPFRRRSLGRGKA